MSAIVIMRVLQYFITHTLELKALWKMNNDFSSALSYLHLGYAPTKDRTGFRFMILGLHMHLYHMDVISYIPH